MLSLREYREPSSRLPDRLPWACLVAPGVVLQKDAIFQRTLAFRGPDLASSLDSELIAASARLNNALRRLGSGWGLFVEAQRFLSSAYPAASWPHPAAAAVDRERRGAFEQAGAHYESSYYLTFTWGLPPDHSGRAADFFYEDGGASGQEGEQRSLERDLYHFEKTVAEVTDILRSVLPEVGLLDDDQTLTYLHSTVSTHRHPVRRPETPAVPRRALPDMPLTPGDVPMLGDHFLCTCTVSGFPASTLPGLLDALNHLNAEYRWVTRFLCLGKPEAKALIEKYRKQWWSKRKGLWTMIKEEASKQEAALIDNAAATKAADADAALQELGDDLVSYGYLTTTVTVWDKDLEEARKKSQRVKEVIQSRGFTVKDETLNSTQAWLGSLPGHVYANVRRPIVNSMNLTHLMPLSSVWAGDAVNQHLESVCGVGSPHLYCSTTGSTPFRLHLAVGDVGHTLIIGPTGSGKSTLLGMLALGWLKYPRAQVIVFDKDRSARAATLAVGGTCIEPGKETAPVAFQPLADIDQPAERIWAAQLVATLLAAQGVAVDHRTQTAIDETLTSLAAAPRQQRTLTLLATQLGSRQRALRDALRPYTLEGNFGQIFDADKDDVPTGAAWTMIEMGHLMAMGPAVVLPALEYLFHRVEAQVRRAADAPHPRRGLALSQPRRLRHAPAGLAQDAAQEERLRRLRDAGGGRRDEQARAALDHPLGLPHQDFPSRRRGADARDGAGLPGHRPDDRRGADPRQGPEEARLLLPLGQGPAPLRARARARRPSRSSAHRASTTRLSSTSSSRRAIHATTRGPSSSAAALRGRSLASPHPPWRRRAPSTTRRRSR